MRALRALTLRGGFVLLVTLALFTSAKAETVRLAVLAPSALLWLHFIADEQGFYADRGLEIEELRAQSSPALLQAVSSGSVEAGISLGDLVIRAVDQGAPIVITGAILDKTILRMIAVQGIDSPDQLAGRNVTAGAVTGGTANMMLYQLAQAGVDPSSVRMVAIPNSRDRIVALSNGQVDGALLIAPFDALAQREGMNLLADFTEPYLQTPLIVNENWAEANPETAAALTQAMAEAADWIYDPANRDTAIAILAERTNAEQEIAASSYAFIVEQQQAIGRGLAMPEASLQNIENINAELEGRDARTLDIGTYYDPSFLAQ